MRWGLPNPTYNKSNNPVWPMSFDLTVERMDNSLAFTNLKGHGTHGKKKFDVCDGIGEFVYVITMEDGQRFALDLKPAILKVVDNVDAMSVSVAPRKTLRKKTQSKKEKK